MKTRRGFKDVMLASVLALALGAAGPAPVRAADDGVVKLSLDQAVQMALKASPEIKEAQASVMFLEGQMDEAFSNKLPQLDVTGLVGPAPNARGNQVSSPDNIRDLNGIGIFTRLEAYLIQPIYTFGKISNNLAAAKAGRASEAAGVKVKAAEVALKVKQYYYGLQMALEGRRLLTEIKDLLGKSRKQTEKLLKADSEDVSEVDIYRLEAMAGRLAGFEAELDEGVLLAQRALARATGHPGKLVMPDKVENVPVKMDLADLVGYQDSALTRRPEMTQVTEGLKAMDALVDAAESNLWPDIFVGAYASYAWAPDRTDIDNPFIIDEFNHVWGGAALGVRWHFDFGVTRAKIKQAKAERLKVKAKEIFARTNLPLQVTQYFLAVKKARRQMEAAKKAYTAARRWLIIASSNYDIGLGPLKEVTDAMETYSLQQAAYIKAVYDYNVGWAGLQMAVGQPVPEVM